MKEILVLGTGCSKCKATLTVIEEVAKSHNFDGTIRKIEDIAQIISYGVMSTPAVVVDGKVAFAGGVPTKVQVESWFENKTCTCGCCK